MPTTTLLTLLTLLAACAINITSASAAHERSYFYVGGNYTLTSDGGQIFTNQMYVERLVPAGGVLREYPIVFVHGNGQTGTNWLNKPDGGDGWASYFLSQGYECYILDQTSRGRSPWTPESGTQSVFTAEHIEEYFTAMKRYNTWPQAHLHTQWPGSGVMGDPIFDAFYASNVPYVNVSTTQQSAVQNAGAQLLDRIGKEVILVGHSQGGTMSWVIADARPNMIHSLVTIEPAGPPFRDMAFGNAPARAFALADIPVMYEPAVTDPESDFVYQNVQPNSTDRFDCIIQAKDPQPRQLANISKFPVLLITTEASYHAQYDWCTVLFLRQAGVRTEHWELAQLGIHGNGHMVFMEKNSDQVAQAIAGWLDH